MVEERFVTPDGRVISQVIRHSLMTWWGIGTSGDLWIGAGWYVGPWRLEGRTLPDGEWTVLRTSDDTQKSGPAGT
jgi:hypothetical protein